MKKINRNFMQQWNKRLVLAIARDNGLLSQADIMRKSGLSAGTVVNITRQLRKDKFLQPAGKGKSIGGRCPVILKFNSSAKYIVSALCLDKETQIALVDLVGAVAGKASFPTRPEQGVDQFINNFKQHMRRLLESKSVMAGQVMALAVSFEGMVDAQSGVLIDCVRLGWKNIPFKEIFEKQFGLNTYVENDGRASALGEFVAGAGKPVRNLVYLVLGSGIGAAIIQEGRLFHGPHQMEGEIGHTVKDPSGPICKCGKRGCLEALASGPAIITAANNAALPGLEEIISKGTEEEAFRHVLRMAEQGNATAKQILENAARLLGHAVADVINLLDTEMVILAGYMAEEDSEYFPEMIRKTAMAHCLDNPKRKVRIVRSVLGHDAALVGGAMLACQDAFASPACKSRGLCEKH